MGEATGTSPRRTIPDGGRHALTESGPNHLAPSGAVRSNQHRRAISTSRGGGKNREPRKFRTVSDHVTASTIGPITDARGERYGADSHEDQGKPVARKVDNTNKR